MISKPITSIIFLLLSIGFLLLKGKKSFVK
jgi:hypothetical protein